MSDELAIPKEGKRIVITQRNKFRVEHFPVQNPKKGEVLVKTVCTQISAGTELGAIELERSQDRYPGYSNAGKVVRVGEGVSEYKIDDRVLSSGKHASHVTVSAQPYSVAKIPQGVSWEQAPFASLGTVAMYGIRKTKIELGEFVAITGMGVVGQLTLQLADQTGCEALIAIDICENRLQVASRNGATHTLNPDLCDLKNEIDTITNGHGLDVAIEASGYPILLPQLFELSRIGGRIMMFGSIWHRTIEMDFMPFHLKDLTLVSCHQPSCPICETSHFPWTRQYNMRQFLKMISDGRVNVTSLISHKLSYKEVAEGYRLLKEEKDKALGVLLRW